MLEKAQKKISETNKELDNLVGTRTRVLLSKLRKVQELPATESVKLLEEAIDFEEETNERN